MQNRLKILRKILSAFTIIIILLGFTEQANLLVGNWYQQFMPIPTGGQLRDITFVDSLLGFAVSDSTILKTTNGGDNWTVKLNGYYIFKRVQFLNGDTGFACGANNKLLKTTNAGDNWAIITPSTIFPIDMSVLNTDTIWLVDNNSLVGGVFRTTNGGANWQQQFSGGGTQNPDHIYMYNARIGFIHKSGFPPDNLHFRRTTDGGQTWPNISNDGFLHMYFIDSLTGWKCTGIADSSMKKTIDGGMTWTKQLLPYGGAIFTSAMVNFTNINIDTIWGVGGIVSYGTGGFRGILYRTTNGGQNWSFQIPDTSIHITSYSFVKFTDRRHGWAYQPLQQGGIHTTTGGDTTFLTGIQRISSNIPNKFKLYQNYPNPFNPVTNIKYQISNSKYVLLSVYDITGRRIIDLVNQRQSPGIYNVDFSGSNSSSGVYFYRIEAGSFVDSKKMVLVK